MAEQLAPGTPEVTDTVLIADLLQFLSVRGSLGRLPLADVVVPVISLGDVRTREVNILTPAFRSVDVFSNGMQVQQAAGTVLADTGPLAAGTFDVRVILSSDADDDVSVEIDLEHRNAADAANLAVWTHPLRSTGPDTIHYDYAFGYEFAVNERLRAVQTRLAPAARQYTAVIFARIR